LQTFTNLPLPVSESISTILSRSDVNSLSSSAKRLHERYMNRDLPKQGSFIQGPSDVLAYLSLRAPATYAQICGALLQIQERIPEWQPKNVLDIGCGPGTGIWAAKTVWQDISSAEGVDQDKYFLTLGQEILLGSKLTIDTRWTNLSITKWIETNTVAYDLIIVANVWNELPEVVAERLLNQVALRSSGVVLVLEPGTSVGNGIIQNISTKLQPKEHFISPYINNSFIVNNEYWVHFPQRFQRPEFQRRIRQSMRESSFMASDWEEAKYSYVAFGNIFSGTKIWGQCIGQTNKQKGFLTIPLLTEEGVVHARVLKRHREQYIFAKNLHWGETIANKDSIVRDKDS